MAEFYNEADHIDYPFIDGFDRSHSGGTVPDIGILDFGVTVGPDTGFLEYLHKVTCTGFNVGATDVIFTFSVESVGLINFVIPMTSPFGFVTTAEIVILGKVVATGLMVTSDLSYFATLPVGAYAFTVPPVIEPTLVISIRGAFITEVVAANSSRRRPLRCCDEADFGPIPPEPAVLPVFSVNTFPISGDVLVFKEGFNCFITLTESSNTLTIGARLGAGLGEDDGLDPFLINNWGFQPATPYNCCDFITSINGVTTDNNVINITASGAIKLESDIPANTINATLSNRGVICP